jgi:peptidoglycan/LPS O-acetylase OafA/YrhL
LYEVPRKPPRSNREKRGISDAATIAALHAGTERATRGSDSWCALLSRIQSGLWRAPLHRGAQTFYFRAQPGSLGVNLFFVLSGFLITGILLESRSRPDYYRRFYARRALRILAAYYSLLILLGILHQASAGFLGLSFIYLSNVTNMFGVSMDYHPLWSLAVEEHYYIVCPSVVENLRPRLLAQFSLAILSGYTSRPGGSISPWS